MWPQWTLNLGSPPFGSVALLAELLRPVLLGRSIISYNHALLILTKWSNSKTKDKRQGSITSRGNISLLDFVLFSHGRASDANIVIFCQFCVFVKNSQAVRIVKFTPNFRIDLNVQIIYVKRDLTCVNVNLPEVICHNNISVFNLNSRWTLQLLPSVISSSRHKVFSLPVPFIVTPSQQQVNLLSGSVGSIKAHSILDSSSNIRVSDRYKMQFLRITTI